MHQKLYQILRENGLNPRLKHRKAKKAILSGRFGEMYGRAGDQCRIQESWHVSIHTLKVCENLKMDILDFESPCDMLNIAV